jgi:hypothetical protein
MAVPFVEIGAPESITFFVAVYDSASVELERQPAHRPIDLQRSADFAARNWTA